MRVHELAKELQADSKILTGILADMGIVIKTHFAALTDEQAEQVRNIYAGGQDKKSSAAAKRPRKKTPKPVTKEAEPEAEPAAPAVTSKVVAVATDGQETKTVIEQRMSGTVIRRRKKADAEPVAPDEVVADTQAAAPEAPQPDVPVPPETEHSVETAEIEGAIDEARADAAEAAGAEPAPAEAKPAQVVRKLRLTEKEATPARIIDRIDLGGRNRRYAEDGVAEPAVPEIPVPVRGTAVKEGAAKEDPEGKRIVAKDRQKRAKFHWQQEAVVTDDDDSAGAPARHKRVRYKLKDKAGRTKKGRAEMIAINARETEITVPKAIKRKIKIHDGITVGELAKRMGVKGAELIKKLLALGVMATINQLLDNDTATLLAADFEYEIETVSVEEETIFEQENTDAEEDLVPRCPVVTVMGHVDHGKTSLLDAIRNTRVAEGEAGGITQHIGAYRVSLPTGDIAFVDTPGHAAFTTMRARGAQVTDIVIIVVAAEEGAMPQTIEAINHARAARVPIIVAVNKIDKPEANPEKIRQELSQHGLLSEEWGGDVLFVDISAKKRINIDKLLESVLLQAEMLELKANPNKPAKGTIVEARLDRGRGPIATVLVQEGTLRAGDSFVSRHNFGKVRALIDDHGKSIKEAGPSTPVEILGFASVPEAGDVFVVVDERKARQTSTYWQQKKRDEDLRKDAKVSLETFLKSAGEADVKELRLILKADVQGSVEAVKQSLENLNTEKVKVNVLHYSVGAISLNDVMLASASNAIIIGFGVKTEPKVHETAESEGIDIRLYTIIYEIIDEVRKAMVGLLAPKYVERLSGRAEIRQVFDISKYGRVAGCFVVEGKVVKGSKARVLRNVETVYEGEITSLKRFKDDAREVLSGQDCGIFLGTFKEFEAGDIIESFSLEQVEQTLE
ncbi:MAG: translation initiation factor IF-2 [Deltaproteobacteria bacterium]|nr:translation initiation factor IF-2 [Deltaproteobacteria bacterium]